jgi:hypothetical protein
MSADERQSSWFQHTLKQQPWRNQTELVATLTLMVIVVIIIGALYLIQTTGTTITARELEQMTDRRDELQRDNELLRAEIAELQSLPRRMTRAAEMGFHEAGPDEIQYIIVDGYQYNRPQVTPTPTPTPPPDDPIYDETLGGWLRQQWDRLKQQFDEWRDG